jgi:predicted SAM-dependent methyltransferase
VIDVRPLDDPIPNVSFLQADLMSEIDVSYEECCDSVSCLHALEHFGLGRYGDPVEYDGHISGLLNLHRILKVGGTLYLSVPIGPLRVEFNAHRVFSIKYLLKLFEGLFAVKSFSYVGDDQILYEDVELDYKNAPNNFNCKYGCGIFELKKLQAV